MKITVLSDGGWGTALASVLCDNGHAVTLWGPFPDYLEEMRRTRRNERFLKGIELPPALVLEADLAKACAGSSILVLAAPSQFMRGMLTKLRDVPRESDVIYLNVAKGIETDTCKRMSELVAEILGSVRYAILSGPSHAEEVARRVPTAVMTASKDAEAAMTVQSVFMNQYLRVYTSDDVVGAELGGSLKNVLALAAGVLDGMGMGDNTKAALMTRGIAEMARLGEALGGRHETFSGLSGIGDLIVTCSSRHSRNRHVGEELGKGRKLEEIQREMGMVVAEGVKTADSAYQLARRTNVVTPIIDEVYTSLYQGKDPRQAVRDLMLRDPKPELPRRTA
ncbi:NAD(P)H-dependent glycerol-3-phosphate dehydrogenase [Opitutus terrae]|uniref:Glycerol-3-phosphate dehydrogenase [NAD(P)+] n=1 Tax=Opitutus terrae (strain DSM 11246 / JCM 15787 / PB90-1) TaxID=452637 RepID=B1ZPR0_OPITP|nr:NAD(P)H-dependent glycerol-3-phosphate dehydrogenase [Opitutus terrae]ACB75513.1 Glycerol-3-phosphate dehydrogenase (NAD(P)(+)) [Opitutus terrae PB90-1]